MELACGTGRISLALAKEFDIDITAIDLSDYMLGEFKEKLKVLPMDIKSRIAVINDNMVSFSSDKKFDIVIIPWRSFQYITDDGEANACLLNCHKHLKDDGLFMIQVFNPPESYNGWLGKKLPSYEDIDPKTGAKVIRSTENVYLNEEAQVIHYLTKFDIHSPDSNFYTIEDLMKYKYYYKSQIEALLKRSGFLVSEFCYDFDFNNKNGTDMIFICRKK